MGDRNWCVCCKFSNFVNSILTKQICHIIISSITFKFFEPQKNNELLAGVVVLDKTTGATLTNVEVVFPQKTSTLEMHSPLQILQPVAIGCVVVTAVLMFDL